MKRSKKQRLTEITATAPDFPLWGMIVCFAWTGLVAVWFFKQAKIPVALILNQWLNSPWAVLPTLDASLRHAKHFAALAGVTIALLAIGRRLLGLAGVRLHNAWEELALSFGLGYGAAGTVLLLLGLAGLWSRGVLLGLLAATLILAALDGWSLYRRGESAPAEAKVERFDIPSLYAITGVIFVWLCTARYALMPETFYDALQYHLGLPSMFLQKGGIFPTPEISYSGIPGLPQMLYGWALALDAWGITAYLLHHSMAMWVGIGMIGYSRRVGRAAAGPLAAAAFFIVPVVLTESFSVSVGMEWALLELCWFASLVNALAEPSGGAGRRAWLIVSGAFLGFAMATKYQAWLLPVAMAPLLFLRFSPPPTDTPSEPGRLHGASVNELLWVLGVAAAVLAPWVLKNVWFYKNPLYPFFHEFFVGKADFIPNWRGMAAGGMSKNYSLLSLSGWMSYAAFPARFLFLKDMFQSTGLFVACLTPLVFLAKLRDSERLLAWVALLSWLSLSLLTEITRYFIPHLALATLLVSCAIAQLRPPAFRTALLWVAGACCAVYGLLWVGLAVDQAKLDVYLGKKGFGEYLTHFVVSYVSPPYSGIEYINEHTPKDSGVILYGDPRGFYLRRRYRTASDDNPSLLELWADRSATPEELRSRLKAERLDYVLINLSEMERRRLWANVPPSTFLKLAAFWKRYAVREFEVKVYPERWVAVYRVLDENEASRPHAEDPLFDGLLNRFSIPQSGAGAIR